MTHHRSKAPVVAAVFALIGAACVVEERVDPAPAEIEFGEMRNLGYFCGGALTSWNVTNRETQDTGTAACEQPVLFTDLAPHAVYTFDITGYDGNKVCWQGSCTVEALPRTRVFADCSSRIAHLCGY